jgi:hypothetical protein
MNVFNTCKILGWLYVCPAHGSSVAPDTPPEGGWCVIPQNSDAPGPAPSLRALTPLPENPRNQVLILVHSTSRSGTTSMIMLSDNPSPPAAQVEPLLSPPLREIHSMGSLPMDDVLPMDHEDIFVSDPADDYTPPPPTVVQSDTPASAWDNYLPTVVQYVETDMFRPSFSPEISVIPPSSASDSSTNSEESSALSSTTTSRHSSSSSVSLGINQPSSHSRISSQSEHTTRGLRLGSCNVM